MHPIHSRRLPPWPIHEAAAGLLVHHLLLWGAVLPSPLLLRAPACTKPFPRFPPCGVSCSYLFFLRYLPQNDCIQVGSAHDVLLVRQVRARGKHGKVRLIVPCVLLTIQVQRRWEDDVVGEEQQLVQGVRAQGLCVVTG